MTSKLATGCGLLIAMLLIAPGGLAQANAVGEAGADAVATAESSYHADGSGAVEAADGEQQEVREKTANELRNSGDAYQDAYADAYAESNTSVDRPECETCRDAAAELEQEGQGSFETAHQAEQAAEVDNEYVDAGADAEATGEAEAWYSELFNGVTDAFDKVGGLMEEDVDAKQQADAKVDQSMDTEGQAREEVASAIEQEQGVESPVEPSTEGSLSGEHAAGAASSAVTEASAP